VYFGKHLKLQLVIIAKLSLKHLALFTSLSAGTTGLIKMLETKKFLFVSISFNLI
jgi:hypothetical protein